MTELDKLIKHLQNLQKSKMKKATFDVDYLLNILLGAVNTTTAPKEVTPVDIYRKVDVDGGGFKD